jgi:hypothetical protein
MTNQKPQDEINASAGSDLSIQSDLKNSPESEAGQIKSSRRQALKRFASYTAPAMIALITANEALAS